MSGGGSGGGSGGIGSIVSTVASLAGGGGLSPLGIALNVGSTLLGSAQKQGGGSKAAPAQQAATATPTVGSSSRPRRTSARFGGLLKLNSESDIGSKTLG